jgi:hypothetical protein
MTENLWIWLRKKGTVLLACVSVFMCFSAHVGATDFSDALEGQLRAEGFSIVEKRKTFLGRLRITATKGKFGRELVINPYTGEVFRDYLHDLGFAPIPERDAEPSVAKEGQEEVSHGGFDPTSDIVVGPLNKGTSNGVAQQGEVSNDSAVEAPAPASSEKASKSKNRPTSKRKSKSKNKSKKKG